MLERKSMCYFCSLWNCLSSIPKVLSKIIVWRFKKPGLYLFQSKISKYLFVSESGHWYLIILPLSWIVLIGSLVSRASTPFAPLYLTWTTLSFLCPNFKLMFYTKSVDIFPIPSVKLCLDSEKRSGISTDLMCVAMKFHEAEKLWPIRAALFAGFAI